MEILFGCGIGFGLNGILHFIFSSKKLSKKLNKKLSDYEIEESCKSCLIFGIGYCSLSVGLILIGIILRG